jgi:hypothetical protein
MSVFIRLKTAIFFEGDELPVSMIVDYVKVYHMVKDRY